jgi:hypothetical protein
VDRGNFNTVEKIVQYETYTIRFHEGFYIYGKEIWGNISQIVLNRATPVIFTGHSRGGSLSHVLHIMASNLAPDKAKNHFSIGFAGLPAADVLGEAIEDHTYTILLNQDPAPRITQKNMVEYVDTYGNATEHLLGLAPYFNHGFTKVGLGMFGGVNAWAQTYKFQNQTVKWNITGFFGRVYWLQNKNVGLGAWGWDTPQKSLSQCRISGDQIGALNFLGLPDHALSLGRYQEFLYNMPCEATESAEFVEKKLEDQVPHLCDNPANWKCKGGGNVNCTLFDNWYCEEDVGWKSADTPIPCDNSEPTAPPNAPPTATAESAASKYWWAILIGVVAGVGIIAAVVVVVILHPKPTIPIVEGSGAAAQSP